MADDSSRALNGNIAGPAHDFRRHIHAELDAIANFRQNLGFKQEPVGRNISGSGFDHPILRLQMERKPERETDRCPDFIPRSRLLPLGQNASFGEPDTLLPERCGYQSLCYMIIVPLSFRAQ